MTRIRETLVAKRNYTDAPLPEQIRRTGPQPGNRTRFIDVRVDSR